MSAGIETLPSPVLGIGFVDQAARAHRLLSEGIVPDGVLRDPIAKSWKRSIAAGADYHQQPDCVGIDRVAVAEAREKDHELLVCAEPFMDSLFEEIQGSTSLVLLTDSRGTVLRATIDSDFTAAALRAGASPGAEWREECRGTNAMAIVLADRIPAEVLGPEHFLPSNAAFACAAAPIFDASGELRGVLDATTAFAAGKTHSLALVRLFAKTIENQLLHSSCAEECLILHFHMRPQFIGTPWEGIALIGPDNRVLCANTSGRGYLGSRDGQQTAEAAFGLSYGALADHARRRVSPLIRLQSREGRQLYAKIEFGHPSPSHGELLQQRRPSRPRPAEASLAAPLHRLDTGDPRLREALTRINRIIGRDISLLIQGETGTGKELLARAVHDSGPRRDKPFVAVNCASIPEGLIESELFGYAEGAFTGARRRGSAGRILQASGGTLFLDEIGDMPEPMQSRLLRVLQEREVVPLGGDRPQKVDLSIISATHRDLKSLITQQQFRQDLYYRLNGLVVVIPPLRERTDLAELVADISQRECAAGEAVGLSDEVAEIFSKHPWPGNVRQLQAVLRTAIAMVGESGIIERADLSDEFLEDCGPPFHDGLESKFGPLRARSESLTALSDGIPAEPTTPHDRPNLHQMESDLVRRVVEAKDGNISAAAQHLGISRNTVYRRLRAESNPGNNNSH